MITNRQVHYEWGKGGRIYGVESDKDEANRKMQALNPGNRWLIEVITIRTKISWDLGCARC